VGDRDHRASRREAFARVQEAVPDLGGARLVLAAGLGARRALPARVPARRDRHRPLGDQRRGRPPDPQGHPACRRRRPGLAARGGRRRPDGAAGAGRHLARPGPDGGRGPGERPVPVGVGPGVRRRPGTGQARRARCTGRRPATA
jgi:hypothetical protein